MNKDNEFNNIQVCNFMTWIITFQPNKYMTDFEDFWKIYVFIGDPKLEKALIKNKFTVNEKFIKSLFKTTKKQFYINENKTILFACNHENYIKQFGNLNHINTLEALDMFGLNVLEQTREKGYVRVK